MFRMLGEEKGRAIHRPLPSGELSPVVGEDTEQTWQAQPCCVVLLGTSGRVSHKREFPLSPLVELQICPEGDEGD